MVVVTKFLVGDVPVGENSNRKGVATMDDIIQLILLILFVVEMKKLIEHDNDKHNK